MAKAEISLLVEQEFLSLTQEAPLLVTKSSGELEAPRSNAEGPRQPALPSHAFTGVQQQ